jgi:hypothetical protein
MKTPLLPAIPVSIIAFCFASCSTNHSGKDYLKTLSEEVKKSNRIVITEHSDWKELAFVERNARESKLEFEYGRREMSGDQKERFLERIASACPAIDNSVSGCIPYYHHTLLFYQKDKLASTMEICFICDIVDWKGHKGRPPASFVSYVLKPTILDVGLKPERDWDGILERRMKQRARH